MSEQANYPSHRIHFGEKTTDQHGKEKIGKPVEVATVWPRKDGKQGGIIQWNIAPEKLGDGVYFHLENERQQTQSNVPQNTNQQQPQDRFDRIQQEKAQSPQRSQGLER